MKLPAVNFHVWKHCNYTCNFCFATFREVPLQLNEAQALATIDALASHCDKLTFVGGEPTLCKFLGALLERARQHGMTTCVVSNGERLSRLMRDHGEHLDLVGLSVDSAREDVNQALGRGDGSHVRRAIELAEEAHLRGIRLKLNTVVTSLTWEEDLSELVRRIRPERWKVFQVLPMRGQNDERVTPLLITKEQFHAFLARHAPLAAEGFPAIPEDNEDMTGSYVMIDPMGRFFDNVDGELCYSKEPIYKVGALRAFEQVRFEFERFKARGGQWQWRRPKR